MSDDDGTLSYSSSCSMLSTSSSISPPPSPFLSSAPISEDLPPNQTQDQYEDISILEEEVGLNEATLSTLSSKLSTIDASISNQKKYILERKAKLQNLKSRKRKQEQTQLTHSKFVKEVEVGLRKCLDVLKKKLEVAAAATSSSSTENDPAACQVMNSNEGGEHNNTFKSISTVEETEDVKEDVTRTTTIKTPQTSNPTASNIERVTLPPPPPPLKIPIISSVQTEIIPFYKHPSLPSLEWCGSNSDKTQKLEIYPPHFESRCYTGTLLPAVGSKILLEKVLNVLMQELDALTTTAMSSSTRQQSSFSQASYENPVLSYGEILREESILGSCLDPFALNCRWHSPGYCRTSPWEFQLQEERISHRLPNLTGNSTVLPQEKESNDQSDHNATATMQHQGKGHQDKKDENNLLKQQEWQQLDPNSVICPYELSGSCEDPSCTYQHLNTRTGMSSEEDNISLRYVSNLPDLNFSPFDPSENGTADATKEKKRKFHRLNATATTFVPLVGAGKTAVPHNSTLVFQNTNHDIKLGDSGTTVLPLVGELQDSEKICIVEDHESSSMSMSESSSISGEDDDHCHPPISTINDNITTNNTKNHPLSKTSQTADITSVPTNQRIAMNITEIPVPTEEEGGWEGEEQDFICLPEFDEESSTCSYDSRKDESIQGSCCSDAFDNGTITHNKKSPSFWWCENDTLTNCNQFKTFSLSQFLGLAGLSIKKNKNDDSRTAGVSSSLMYDHNHHRCRADISNGDALCNISFIGAALDCIRVCIFAGRWDYALAIRALSHARLQQKIATAKHKQEEGVEENAESSHGCEELLIYVLENGLSVIESTVGCNAAELFCKNVILHLVAESMHGFYNGCGVSSMPMSDLLNPTRELFEKCFTAMDDKRTCSITPDDDDHDGELERHIHKVIAVFPSKEKEYTDLFTCLRKRTLPRLLSFSSSTKGENTLCKKLLYFTSVGNQLGKLIVRLSIKAQVLSQDFSFILIVVESIWNAVDTYLFSLNSQDKSESGTHVLYPALLFGPVMFAFSKGILAAESSSSTEKNKHVSFFLDTKSFASISIVDSLFQRALTKMQRMIGIGGGDDQNNYSIKLHELLLAPLVSLSVAITVQLRKHAKAQARLEHTLSLTTHNKNPAVEGERGGGIRIMIFSELIWSQLITLRSLLPCSALIPKSKLTAQNSILSSCVLRYEVHPSHLILAGNSKMLVSAMFGAGTTTEDMLRTRSRQACVTLFRNIFDTPRGGGSSSSPATEEEATEDHDMVLSSTVKQEEPISPDVTKTRVVGVLKLSDMRYFGRSFNTVPLGLLLMKNMTRLLLKRCKLSFLPETLGMHLPKLEEIDCSKNRLTQLPNSIYSLKHLTILNVSSNKLTELSEHVGKLTELTHLNAQNNQIRTIPRDLALKLDKLRVLNLSGNPVDNDGGGGHDDLNDI